jgi:hypothetical protein
MAVDLNEVSEWAIEEFQELNLGDARLNKRVMLVADRLARRPNESIPTAMNGWAETSAAYRLFANEKTTVAQIRQSHAEKTTDRIANEPVVLIVQDTTELDYTAKALKNRSVGPLNWKERFGFLLHCSIAVTPEGLHLGTIDAQVWARDAAEFGKADHRKQRDFEEKESRRWRDAYRVARGVAEVCPKTSVINVADRESDIFEYLVEATGKRPENAHFLIRASADRCLTELDTEAGETSFVKMRDRLRQTAPVGEVTIHVPKRGPRKAREAVLEIRIGRLELKAPDNRRGRLPNVEVNVVWATEKNPPEGEAEPIDWLLLTDLPTTTLDEALTVLGYYARRWQIEVFFRVLKSGCEVEELEFHSLEHFGPCLMLYLVVSWRILNLMMVSRECPDLSCEVLLTAAEWKAAWQIRHRTKPPSAPPRLADMVRLIASFGGHLGRKCDGLPGPKSLWIGLQRVMDFALAWTTFGPDEHPEKMTCV